MPFTRTDDAQEIYFEVHGTEISKTTLVFISGYFGVANIWQPLISRLSPRYRCVAYDSRGYGRSSKPDDPELYSVPRHAEDLHAVITASNLTGQIVPITHSMGGNIGAAYYLAHPGIVAGIIQTATYFDGKSIQENLPYNALISGVESPSKCVEFYTNMGLDLPTALEAAKWPAHARRHNARALLQFEIGDQYARFKVPGLVIQGELDKAIPAESQVRPIAQAMPYCRMCVLKGVNHFPPTEAVGEMERLVGDFVEELF